MTEIHQPGKNPELAVLGKLNTVSLDAVDAMRSAHQISVEGYKVGDSIFVDGNSEGPASEYTPITVDIDLADVVSTCVERMNAQGMAYGIGVSLDTPSAEDCETRTYLVQRHASHENIDDYFSFMLVPESIATYDYEISQKKTKEEALRQVASRVTRERVNEGMVIFMAENGKFYTERTLLRAKQD